MPAAQRGLDVFGIGHIRVLTVALETSMKERLMYFPHMSLRRMFVPVQP